MKRLTEVLEDGQDRADITPLIDVIFMLLLFFIITTTFAEDTFFPIELPKAERAPDVRTPADTAVVEISREGEFAVNRQPLPSRRRLYDNLARLKGDGLEAVVIKADQECAARHIVAVLDMLQALKIDEFAVTAQPL